MEILHFEDWGYKCRQRMQLGINLVIDNFLYVASGTSPLYKIWKQSDYYLWRYCILKIWGIQVLFGCESSCSSARRVSNFNSKVTRGGIYLHIQFERDRLNIFQVRVLTSSRRTRTKTRTRRQCQDHNITEHFVWWYNYSEIEKRQWHIHTRW